MLELCQVTPLSILYSIVFVPVALTTIVPVETVHVGCVTVGALTTGAVQQVVIVTTTIDEAGL